MSKKYFQYHICYINFFAKLLNILEILGMIITPIASKIVKFWCGIYQKAVFKNPFIVIYLITGFI